MEHKSSGAETYYYYKKDALPYIILNKNENENENENGYVAKAEGAYHNKTYGQSETDTNAYSHVQINAEPMYWQTKDLYTLGSGDCSESIGEVSAVDYYILTISWTENQIRKGQIANNKETDLIYITIGQEKSSDEKNP